jgi:predicted permease
VSILLSDLRYAVRSLFKSPGFAVTSILILALGIGAVTAVFSVVNSVILQPYPFRDPAQLVIWREKIQEERRYPVLPDNYLHYQNLVAHSSTVAAAALMQNASFAVTVGDDHPQILNGLSVSPSFFSVLGMTPLLGRGFLPRDAQKGSNQGVVITWWAWRRLFNSDPKVIGRAIKIKGEQRVVVGVLAKDFDFPIINEMPTGESPGKTAPYEMFQTFVPQGEDLTSDDGDFDLLVVARLKPGVTAQQAASELDSLQKAYSSSQHLPFHLGAAVEPFLVEVIGNVSKALWLLQAAVGGLLLIACVNLASLQMARSVSHDRENALRAALGAGGLRLFQATLMESFVLSAIGCISGILLAFGGIRLFRAVAPENLPRMDNIQLNWTVLLFAAGISLFAALVSGSLPALRSLKTDPHKAIQSDSTRMSSTKRATTGRRLLVTFEIACTVVLLMVTGLIARSFSRVLNQSHAFNANHLIIAEVNLLATTYKEGKSSGSSTRSAFIERALDMLGTHPFIESVSITSTMPLTGDSNVHSMYRPDHVLPESEVPNANVRIISPGYFRTMNTQFTSGQDFGGNERDNPNDAIISQSAAAVAFSDLQPLGRQLKINGDVYRVVGIVSDARILDLKEDTPVVYLPFWHDPPDNLFFLVRSSLTVDTIASTLQHDIWNVDPAVAIPVVKSFNTQLTESIATERLQVLVLSAFGAAALILAVLGVYGVMAYSVSLRTPEFGIRLALGSSKLELTRLVLWEACHPVTIGLILGIVAALGAARAIRSLLFETRPIDPEAIAVSIGLLLLATFLAALIPAYRASRTDPMRILRQE